jgi:hypothetical protein
MEMQQIEMLAEMKANQAKMDANQAKAAKQEEMLAKMEADRKTHREDLKGMMEEMNIEMDGNQAEMRSTICAIQSELEEAIQYKMKAIIQPIRAGLDEMTACNGTTETEPDPGMMLSIEEPVREPRKRRRVRNLAAEHHQKQKERTRGYSGSRKKSAAICRKVSCRANVARGKRNLIRKIQVQASQESRKELAVAHREMMHCAKVAWCKERSREGPSVEQG